MDANWRVIMTPCPEEIDCIEAEIYYGYEQWATFTECVDVILFLPRGVGEPWAFMIHDVLAILKLLSREELKDNPSIRIN